MNQQSWSLESAIRASDERHRQLARLPIAEKVKILIELQKIAAPLLRARGMKVRIWTPDAPETTRNAIIK